MDSQLTPSAALQAFFWIPVCTLPATPPWIEGLPEGPADQSLPSDALPTSFWGSVQVQALGLGPLPVSLLLSLICVSEKLTDLGLFGS